MGKHKEWRKIAKKIRRKLIRTKLAKIRDALQQEEEEKERESPSYAIRLAEEKARREAEEEAERRKHEEEEKKWEEEEKRVQEETALRQALLIELEKAKERKRIQDEENKRKKEEAEKKRQEKFTEYIYEFALGERSSLPVEMLIPSETQPGKEICPFFSKVAACRFWDSCSRNHIRPALSDTLLFPGFYSHFAMSRIGLAEYDTDMSLEYDDKETYAHFLEFYRDIRYEFESLGRLTQLVVCCNPEAHLRGNVYISYASEKETMAAYLKFNGRYYGGKQLSPQFVTIPSWRSAVCGLYFKKKCPKGNNCNFLHVFKDPGPPFYEPKNRRSPDDWRWSVSPEREIKNKEKGNNKNTKSLTENGKRKKKEKRRSRSKDREKIGRSRERRGRSKEKSMSKERRSRSIGRRRKRSRSRDRNSLSEEWRDASMDRRSKSRERRKSRSKERRRSRSRGRRRSRSRESN